MTDIHVNGYANAKKIKGLTKEEGRRLDSNTDKESIRQEDLKIALKMAAGDDGKITLGELKTTIKKLNHMRDGKARGAGFENKHVARTLAKTLDLFYSDAFKKDASAEIAVSDILAQQVCGWDGDEGHLTLDDVKKHLALGAMVEQGDLDLSQLPEGATNGLSSLQSSLSTEQLAQWDAISKVILDTRD